MAYAGQVEDSEEEDVVDEGAGVDDQLLACNERCPSWDVENGGCLCQRRWVVIRTAILLNCALPLMILGVRMQPNCD